jgi:ketosteroid isomerase-like protein
MSHHASKSKGVHTYARGWLALTCAVLSACASASVGSSESKTAEQEIRAALADWVIATAAGDRQRANAVWAKDLIGWYPGQPDDTYAREMAAAAMQRPPGPPPVIPSVEIVEVIVSGNMAVVRDIWRMKRSTGSDTAAVQIIKSFEVWRRESDGKWRIARWISAPEPTAR